jgi:hypothetical protein
LTKANRVPASVAASWDSAFGLKLFSSRDLASAETDFV